MKVALVGNMNNNFFSLMRYFRDLGVDAHLLMFSDETAHFLPENDTWQIDRWKPYIRTLDLENTEWGLITTPAEKVKKALVGYDAYIGCGITPAYFYRAGLRLDMFIPYAYGIEFYGYHKVNLRRPWREMAFQAAKFWQERGMKFRTDHIITCDKTPYNRRVFRKLGIEPVWLPTPMVYNREEIREDSLSPRLKEAVALFKERDVVLFSHVSHKWKKIPRDWNNISIKSNDVLIRGFAEFVMTKTSQSPLMVLIEYGYDVMHSKTLIKELGIEDRVYWLPLLSRKEIMYLLEYVDLGGAELGGVMWGGTGWEFLSKGVPFFQNLEMTEEGFLEMTGAPMPPFLNVKKESEICNTMIDFVRHQDIYKKIGHDLKIWFDKYNGISLTQKFNELLMHSDNLNQ